MNFFIHFLKTPKNKAKRIIQNRQLELELQGREITENDYEQLLQLDRPASPDDPGVPEHILNLL